MAAEFRWYCLRAMSGKELKVKAVLDAEIANTDLGQNVQEVVVPTEKVISTVGGKKVEKEKVLLNFYISKAKKKEYEKLFGAEGLSLSHGIRMCLDYAALQISAGKLIISDSGIHENILNNLK